MEKPIRHPLRRYLRLSVRSLIVLVLMAGAWLGWLVRGARVQRNAVAAIEKAGGRVMYDWQWRDGTIVPNGKPWLPQWFVDHLGVDYFHDVSRVVFPAKASDAEMAHLGNLTRVDTLVLDPSNVSDRELAQLDRLKNLRWLTISTSIGSTDTRIMPLKVLTRLRGLNLDQTDVTDAGLKHLNHFTGLELLGLAGTEISDAGLANLGGLTALKHLFLDRTQVSDEGLVRLKPLTNLAQVQLKATKVTDAGVAELKKSVPNLRLFR
jgi:internalin A